MKTEERAPFWCTLLIFTRADGKRFMPPIIVHQAKYSLKYFHFNIPLEWTFHHTSYGYMDRDEWLEAMIQFSNLRGDSPIKNERIFFDGHNGHINKHTLMYKEKQTIQPFVLKIGSYRNNHPNDISPNANLKSHYNHAKSTRMLKYGMARMSTHHMNSILAEALDNFKLSAGKTIRDRFLTQNYLPSVLPN